MGRCLKGSVEYLPATRGRPFGHYSARVTTQGKKRVRINFDPEPESPEALCRAKALAVRLSAQVRKAGLVACSRIPYPHGEPGSDAAWWERFFDHREERELSSVRSLFRRYIQPRLTDLGVSISTLRTTDCETIRNRLDLQADAGLCGHDAACHAWYVLSAACKAACGQWRHDRQGTLKIRADNPCAGLFPPLKGKEKELQWLYPDEFLALVSCEAVPLEFRRRYALATYLFCRAGEYALLDFSTDFDLRHGVVSIRRSWNRQRKKAKLTKTGTRGFRRFSIEPTLLPLLQAMYHEHGGKGRLCRSLRNLSQWPSQLREHLKLAGVDRPELFETDETRRRLRFHDLRATGLTWLALRGENPIAIHTRAGHTQWGMTEKYVRMAETLGQLSPKSVFPELPSSLMGKPVRPDDASVNLTLMQDQQALTAAQGSPPDQTDSAIVARGE